MNTLAYPGGRNQGIKSELGRISISLRRWDDRLRVIPQTERSEAASIDPLDPVQKEWQDLMCEDLFRGVTLTFEDHPTAYYAAIAENLIQVADKIVDLRPRVDAVS
jgi:hypothetical protein